MTAYVLPRRNVRKLRWITMHRYTLTIRYAKPKISNLYWIEHKDSVKYHGMYLDYRINWDHHVNKKNKKCNTLLIIRTLFRVIYKNQLWGCGSKPNINAIQHSQNIVYRLDRNIAIAVLYRCLQ